MRVVLAALTVVTVTGLMDPRPGYAQNAPWCATYYERGGGTRTCGFASWQQCQASVSGVGGFCSPNPAFQPGYGYAPGPRSRNYAPY
jgi:hypothetical protein